MKGTVTRLVRGPGFRALMALLGVLLLGCVFNAGNTFFKFKTHHDLLGAVAINGILACGMTLVIITAGIDLSVGSVLGVCAMCFPLFTMAYGWHPVPAFVACLVIGALAGAVNGVLITVFGMQPFVATLAMMVSARGVAKYVPTFANLGPAKLGFLKPGQKIQPIEGLGPPVFDWIDGPFPPGAREALASFDSVRDLAARLNAPLESPLIRLIDLYREIRIPTVTVLFLICVAILWVALTQTRFGRHLYAIGGNEESSRLSGIRVGWNKLAAYSICGLTSGLAGICQAARDHHGNPEAGFTFELQAIAAVVIGGTSLMGGRGGILLTLVGVLIIGYIEKILSINNVQEAGRYVIQGLIIVVAVVIQRKRA